MKREEIEELKGLAASMGFYDDKNPCKRAVILGKAIKALEQEPVIDKIRAEIANHCGVNTDYCDSCRFCTDSIEVREILQIIDKYKTESEEI